MNTPKEDVEVDYSPWYNDLVDEIMSYYRPYVYCQKDDKTNCHVKFIIKAHHNDTLGKLTQSSDLNSTPPEITFTLNVTKAKYWDKGWDIVFIDDITIIGPLSDDTKITVQVLTDDTNDVQGKGVVRYSDIPL